MMNEKQIVEKLYRKYQRPITAGDVQEITGKTRGNTLLQLKSYVKLGQIYIVSRSAYGQFMFKPA